MERTGLNVFRNITCFSTQASAYITGVVPCLRFFGRKIWVLCCVKLKLFTTVVVCVLVCLFVSQLFPAECGRSNWARTCRYVLSPHFLRTPTPVYFML